MANRYILALDPSGNYNEGKGTTGWCLLDTHTNKIAKYGILKASNYKSQLDYWHAHVTLIDDLCGYSMHIVLEDYLLYANRADSQIGSRLETPKLIGMLEYECYLRTIKVTFQTAAQVKKRWTNKILEHKNIISIEGKRVFINGKPVSEHTVDSIRHAIHYATFGKDK